MTGNIHTCLVLVHGINGKGYCSPAKNLAISLETNVLSTKKVDMKVNGITYTVMKGDLKSAIDGV